jgi:hypothetical protein
MCKLSVTTPGAGNAAQLRGCDQPPECTGDAIQCAMLTQQWEARCATVDLNGTELGDALSGTDSQAASKQRDQSQAEHLIDLPNQLNQSGFLARTCPADQTYQIMSATVTIPFSSICGVLEFMGNVALAFSLLGAARVALVI